MIFSTFTSSPGDFAPACVCKYPLLQIARTNYTKSGLSEGIPLSTFFQIPERPATFLLVCHLFTGDGSLETRSRVRNLMGTIVLITKIPRPPKDLLAAFAPEDPPAAPAPEEPVTSRRTRPRHRQRANRIFEDLRLRSDLRTHHHE